MSSTNESRTRMPAHHPDAKDRDPANRDPLTGTPGAHPVGSGVGAAGGAASGAAIGGVVGGPVGAGVGAVVGGVVGGLAGKGVAEAVNPTEEDAYWREHYQTRHYYENGRMFEDYQPAYRTGYQGYVQHGAGGRSYDEAEADLRADYERDAGGGMPWDRARFATRDAWDRVSRRSGQAVAGVAGDRHIRTLNSFLRGEISAVETYRQAIEKFGAQHRTQLEDCLRSHERRVALLRDHIQSLGGEPSSSSGAWGAFAKFVEGGAKLFGESSAIAALEEGEDHGRNDYQRDLDQLDAASRQFMVRDILPEQERTHGVLSALKKSLS